MNLFARIFLKLDRMGMIKFLPDKIYLKIMYKIRVNKKLNLKNPITFNEKLQWLKLNNRKPEYTSMVDKYLVKKYVESVIGGKYIIPTYGVWDNFKDINFNELPNQFVIKCTHDSGGLFICQDKKQFNYELCEKKINKSLKTNYYYKGREWPYKNVKPKIIIEKYISDNNVKDLYDYKVMSFNGEPKFIQIHKGRKTNHTQDFYDINWEKLDIYQGCNQSTSIDSKPPFFDEMIELSRVLSTNIPCVRIDWYYVNGQLYFGEITFFDGSGLMPFIPDFWDYEFGKLIELKKIERTNKKLGILGVGSSYGGRLQGAEKGSKLLIKADILKKISKDIKFKKYGICKVKKPTSKLNYKIDKLNNCKEVCELSKQVYNKTKIILNNNEIPIIIGGDHSISSGSVMALSEKYENLGLIWIDAHADFNDENITNSGNLHGMPLSSVCGYGPEVMIDFSNKKYINIENIVLIGGRDYEPKEKDKLDSLNIKYFMMEDIIKNGLYNTVNEAIKYLKSKTDNIYISFDIDVLSPNISPGTGVSVDGGFSYEEAIFLLNQISNNFNIVAFDIVEFNPLLDKGKKTYNVSQKILSNIFNNI